MDLHGLLLDWLQSTFRGQAALAAQRIAPDFVLPDDEGWLTSSRELRARGPYVLTFFHGGWCTACVARLQGFDDELDRIHALGADIVAVSPDTFDHPRKLKGANGWRLMLLSDVDYELGLDLGITFAVPPEVRALLAGRGIDLSLRHGSSAWMLPVPMTYVVDRDGFAVEAFAESDDRAGSDMDAITTALSKLKASR